MAFVHDEYGHFEGLVTPGNLLTALAGMFVSSSRSRHRSAAGRARGRQLVGVGLGLGRRDGRHALRQPARRPRLCDRGGLRLVGAEAHSRGRARASPIAAGGSRSPTWTGARSTSCWPARSSGGTAGRKRGRPNPACRTSPRSRRCRRGRDSRPVRRCGRGRGGPGTGPSARRDAATSLALRPASWSKRVMPSSFRRATNLGPTPFSRWRSSAGPSAACLTATPSTAPATSVVAWATSSATPRALRRRRLQIGPVAARDIGAGAGFGAVGAALEALAAADAQADEDAGRARRRWRR